MRNRSRTPLYESDPGEPTRLEVLNPRKRVRYTDPKDEFDGLENPGYTVVQRQPRVNGFAEQVMDPDAATRIEEMFKAPPGSP